MSSALREALKAPHGGSFSGGQGIKNLPRKIEDVDSILHPGTKIPQAVEQIAQAHMPQLESLRSAVKDPAGCN